MRLLREFTDILGLPSVSRMGSPFESVTGVVGVGSARGKSTLGMDGGSLKRASITGAES